MSAEYQPKLGEDGQYHFFDIVSDPGHIGTMFEDRSAEYEREKLEKFREEKRQKAQRIFDQLKIPSRYLPENCFVALDLFGGYPDGDENLVFIDKDTGLIMQEISVVGDAKEKDENVRTYTPRVLSQFHYEGIVFDHPILGNEVSAVGVSEKSWRIDKLFRRRERYGTRVTVGQIGDEWDSETPQPRRMHGALMDVEFVVEDPERFVSVDQPEKWVEKTRAFFTPERMIIYGPTDDNKAMKLIPPKKSPFLETDRDLSWIENLPQTLPGPATVLF